MTNPGKIVWFPHWPAKLRELRLPALRQKQYKLTLIRYLQFCKESRQQATVESARAFMETIHAKRMLSLSLLATWKEALNWFFREGRKQMAAGHSIGAHPGAQWQPPPAPQPRTADGEPRTEVMTDVPSQGSADLGKTDWERRLIEVLRSRHYQWRTELAYRQWAHRFAAWLQRRAHPLENATAEQVRDFLTDLATQRRVSASTQKQALNALVFLLREALQRDPGEFGDYARAEKSIRLPVVLTRDECRRLFAVMEGTTRLMAELMYGRVKGFASRGFAC